jgi:hypothetical protein
LVCRCGGAVRVPKRWRRLQPAFSYQYQYKYKYQHLSTGQAQPCCRACQLPLRNLQRKPSIGSAFILRSTSPNFNIASFTEYGVQCTNTRAFQFETSLDRDRPTTRPVLSRRRGRACRVLTFREWLADNSRCAACANAMFAFPPFTGGPSSKQARYGWYNIHVRRRRM